MPPRWVPVVQLARLQISHLRCIENADLALHGGINLITGDNGAGKTSVIEALHVLSHGRSFRGRVRDGLIQHGASVVRIIADWRDANASEHRAGLEHDGKQWQARLDGESAKTLAELASPIAMVCFEPGSHALLTGPAENRRRFVDWGLFHVEPDFLDCWRRYSRALRQRNALLKANADDSLFASWEYEMQLCGEQINVMRGSYLHRWQQALVTSTMAFLPELAAATVSFLPGWKADVALADALRLHRVRDRVLGFTGVGPHRADWRISFGRLSAREGLSRGQTKLSALACVLAQAREFASVRGHWPIVCLDDLASELDQTHQQRVVDQVVASAAQVVITATEPIPVLAALDVTRFHVEQGEVTALL